MKIVSKCTGSENIYLYRTTGVIMHNPIACLLPLLILILVSTPGFADVMGITENATTQAFADAGFQVNTGKMEMFDVTGMYEAGISSSCYANNPSAPYMLSKIPDAPGQTAQNHLSDAPLHPENAGLWAEYKLRPDEAIVYLGTTPPECDYFSYCGYIVMRYFPAEGQVRRVFASLGDTINRQKLQMETIYGNDPFKQPIIVIFSADTNTAKTATTALIQAGYPEDIIHTLPIPHTMVKMGLEAESDSFTLLHRMAFFQNTQDGDSYMNSTPGVVYRLTPDEYTEPAYFPVPELIVRGTGDTRELDLYADLEELKEAILDTYGRKRAEEMSTEVWLYEGYDGIQRNIDVLGETRDTVYLKTSNTTLGDNPDEFIIVYGVNHAATKKSTYANFGLYGTTALNGIGGVSNHDYTGTAESYIPNNPNAKYLYVGKIARQDDGSPATVAIPYDALAHGIELDEPCFVGFRAYVEPDTKVGPIWSEIVYDRAIKFNP